MASDKINIGDLDTRICFLRETKTVNEKGQIIKDFEPCAEGFAKVDIISADESEYNENMSVMERVRVITYNDPQITAKWRLRINCNKDYEITSVVPVRRSPFVEIEAFRTLNEQ